MSRLTPYPTETSQVASLRLDRNRAVLLALSVAGVALVFWMISRYGAAISPDSTAYISAARSVAQGHGLRQFDQTWLIFWPPLYPVLLSAFEMFKIDSAFSGGVINALAFGVAVFLFGHLLLETLHSRALALVGAAGLLCYPPLVRMAGTVMSDTLFVLLELLFLLFIARFLATRTRGAFIAMIIVAALACLQRYVGVMFVLAGGVLLLIGMRGAPWYERLWRAALFGVVSIVPLALWLGRNYLLTGTLTGQRADLTDRSLYTGAAITISLLVTWFVPLRIPALLRLALLCLAPAVILVAVVRFHHRVIERTPLQRAIILSAATLLVTSAIFLVVSSQEVMYFRQRLLIPLYPPALLLACVIIEEFLYLFATSKWQRLAQILVGCLIALWFIPGIRESASLASSGAREGAGGFSTVEWHTSPTVAWVQANAPPEHIFGNSPDALYMLSNVQTNWSPFRDEDLARFRAALPSNGANYLVWFHNRQRTYMYTPEELGAVFTLEKVATFPDGDVYRLEK